MTTNLQEIEVHESIREFSYVSEVFKYIEDYHLMGHQIGRKVGDMLELITMSKIFTDPELAKRIRYEPKILGATDAGHKVEFGFYEKLNGAFQKIPFGLVECKRVGVEVTKQRRLLRLKPTKSHKMTLSSKWLPEEIEVVMQVKDIFEDHITVNVTVSQGYPQKINVHLNGRIKIAVGESGKMYVLEPGKSLRSITEIIRICKFVSLEELSNSEAKWRIWDCLTGPQTIEKAKQAAFVAMDVRKKVDGKWGKEDLKEGKKKFTSILVITEASHWEKKSRKVITTCIDHNIIVPDKIVVEAFKLFEKKFGRAKMLNYIAKNQYLENSSIRELMIELLTEYKGKLFYDLNLGTYIDFKYERGKLVAFSV